MAACGRLDMLPGPTHSRARHLLRSTAYLRGAVASSVALSPSGPAIT